MYNHTPPETLISDMGPGRQVCPACGQRLHMIEIVFDNLPTSFHRDERTLCPSCDRDQFRGLDLPVPSLPQPAAPHEPLINYIGLPLMILGVLWLLEHC